MTTLALIRYKDSGGPRHGGWRTYRHFKLFLNGFEIRSFSDDNASSAWLTGERLDRYIAGEVALFERALGCRVIRGRSK